MGEYYHMAIEKGNSDAMFSLGLYYESINDYINMKKYYNMAIMKGDSGAMYSLAKHYHRITL